MPDIQGQAEDRVLAIIQGMQLPWPGTDEIRARRLPWDQQGGGTIVIHRGITVYPLKPVYAAGTNEREDVGYGVGIAFIAPADHSTRENRHRIADVRAKIRRKIVEDRLSLPLISGATYIQTKVADGDVNIPQDSHRYEVSGLTVRCWVREPRT